MNVLHIFGIAILLVSGIHSVQNAKTDNDLQQRILLRKLQNFQETKPMAWNEVLADALVNKIKIFSFTTQEREITANDAPDSHQNILKDFFSKALVVYKKFVYDTFVGKRKTRDDELLHFVTPEPTNVDIIPKKVPEEVIIPTQVTFLQGPKSEVEFVEPKYHGKITLEENSENQTQDTHPNKKDGPQNINETSNPEITNIVTNPQASIESNTKSTVGLNYEEVNPVTESANCPEGYVKSESGECVKSISRLILAVPNQCPIGYKKDWLGYCRKVFHF